MGIVAAHGLHRRKHPEPVDGCWGCKALTVQFGSAEGDGMRRRDREFAADQEAYRRLRRDGLQPQSPQGASEVERRQMEQVEIDMKMQLPKDVKERHKDIIAEQALREWTGGGVNG